MGESILTSRQRRALQRQLTQTRDARVYRRTLALLEVDRGTPIARIAAALARDYFLFRIRSPARLVPPFDSRVPCSCEA